MARLLVQHLRLGVVMGERDWARERLLVSLGEAAVPPLVEQLRDRDEEELRRWAARLLSQVGGTAAVASLRPLASDPDAEIRLAAGKLLASVRDEAAVDVLGPLADKGVPWMRYEALQVLGELAHPRALPVLLRAFTDRDFNVRMRAGGALQQLGAPAVPALIELARTVEADLRASILSCLRHIGDPRAVSLALGQLDAPDRHVRAAAIACVGRLRPPEARAFLEARLPDPEPAVRGALCEALGALGDRASVPLLLRLLKEDGDSGVRAAAARALGKCGEAETAIPLLHLLLAEEDAPLLEALLEGLGELGDARILELLELFEPRRMRHLSRKERTRLLRKLDYAAGRIRSRLP
jgi:HEAT repeat protein